MSLLDDIRSAQIRAGEDAVTAHLRELGLVDDPEYCIEETDVDVEAVAWAYEKLTAFGCANNTMDNALMMDRLKAMLGA